MNIRYNAIFKSYCIDFDIDIPHFLSLEERKLRKGLPQSLLRHIDNNINIINNIFYFTQPFSDALNLNKLTEMDDLIEIECSINKIYLPTHSTNKYSSPLNLLRTGLKFAALLNRKFQNEFEDESFKIIFSFRISKYVDANIFFHKNRSGLVPFLKESFEEQTYIDGILTIDTK